MEAINEDWDFVGFVWYFVFEGFFWVGVLVWFDFGWFVCLCMTFLCLGIEIFL